jgi:aryl-alcohol dehydrogenase-like predicted oxidoreductase
MESMITIGGDLSVPRLGFGAMRLCGPRVLGRPADDANAHAVLKRAVELGVALIDTADAYGPHVNEEQIAEALYPYPSGLLIASKCGSTRPEGRWVPNGRPEYLRSACEGSLKRLRLERIDLYQLHSPDPHVPLAESIGALGELQREGKIRHIGISNVGVTELEEAQAVAAIASVQNEYNVGNRESEAVLEACEREGVAFLPYFPIDGGDLAKSGGALARIAAAHGATPAQVALAWLLARSPSIAPIPGTASLAHLAENVAAARLELTQDEWDALDRG